jgi:hypothetical protein
MREYIYKRNHPHERLCVTAPTADGGGSPSHLPSHAETNSNVSKDLESVYPRQIIGELRYRRPCSPIIPTGIPSASPILDSIRRFDSDTRNPALTGITPEKLRFSLHTCFCNSFERQKRPDACGRTAGSAIDMNKRTE